MAWLKSPVLIIVATQLLFTTGDLLARANMRHSPFALATFLKAWFLVYFGIRQIAMFGQLYVFTTLQVGKTMALFSATSLVLVNVLGVLLLGEVLSAKAYVAIAMVVLAFIVLSVSSFCLHRCAPDIVHRSWHLCTYHERYFVHLSLAVLC
jgi:multidrug transporter EmrE-like cation transporter